MPGFERNRAFFVKFLWPDMLIILTFVSDFGMWPDFFSTNN